MGRKAKDLTGKRFGKLIVKSRAEDTYSRRWIGIELSEDYCEIIKNRLENIE